MLHKLALNFFLNSFLHTSDFRCVSGVANVIHLDPNSSNTNHASTNNKHHPSQNQIQSHNRNLRRDSDSDESAKSNTNSNSKSKDHHSTATESDSVNLLSQKKSDSTQSQNQNPFEYDGSDDQGQGGGLSDEQQDAMQKIQQMMEQQAVMKQRQQFQMQEHSPQPNVVDSAGPAMPSRIHQSVLPDTVLKQANWDNLRTSNDINGGYKTRMGEYSSHSVMRPVIPSPETESKSDVMKEVEEINNGPLGNGGGGGGEMAGDAESQSGSDGSGGGGGGGGGGGSSSSSEMNVGINLSPSLSHTKASINGVNYMAATETVADDNKDEKVVEGEGPDHDVNDDNKPKESESKEDIIAQQSGPGGSDLMRVESESDTSNSDSDGDSSTTEPSNSTVIYSSDKDPNEEEIVPSENDINKKISPVTSTTSESRSDSESELQGSNNADNSESDADDPLPASVRKYLPGSDRTESLIQLDSGKRQTIFVQKKLIQNHPEKLVMGYGSLPDVNFSKRTSNSNTQNSNNFKSRTPTVTRSSSQHRDMISLTPPMSLVESRSKSGSKSRSRDSQVDNSHPEVHATTKMETSTDVKNDIKKYDSDDRTVLTSSETSASESMGRVNKLVRREKVTEPNTIESTILEVVNSNSSATSSVVKPEGTTTETETEHRVVELDSDGGVSEVTSSESSPSSSSSASEVKKQHVTTIPEEVTAAVSTNEDVITTSVTSTKPTSTVVATNVIEDIKPTDPVEPNLPIKSPKSAVTHCNIFHLPLPHTHRLQEQMPSSSSISKQDLINFCGQGSSSGNLDDYSVTIGSKCIIPCNSGNGFEAVANSGSGSDSLTNSVGGAFSICQSNGYWSAWDGSSCVEKGCNVEDLSLYPESVRDLPDAENKYGWQQVEMLSSRLLSSNSNSLSESNSISKKFQKKLRLMQIFNLIKGGNEYKDLMIRNSDSTSISKTPNESNNIDMSTNNIGLCNHGLKSHDYSCFRPCGGANIGFGAVATCNKGQWTNWNVKCQSKPICFPMSSNSNSMSSESQSQSNSMIMCGPSYGRCNSKGKPYCDMKTNSCIAEKADEDSDSFNAFNYHVDGCKNHNVPNLQHNNNDFLRSRTKSKNILHNHATNHINTNPNLCPLNPINANGLESSTSTSTAAAPLSFYLSLTDLTSLSESDSDSLNLSEIAKPFVGEYIQQPGLINGKVWYILKESESDVKSETGLDSDAQTQTIEIDTGGESSNSVENLDFPTSEDQSQTQSQQSLSTIYGRKMEAVLYYRQGFWLLAPLDYTEDFDGSVDLTESRSQYSMKFFARNIEDGVKGALSKSNKKFNGTKFLGLTRKTNKLSDIDSQNITPVSSVLYTTPRSSNYVGIIGVRCGTPTGIDKTVVNSLDGNAGSTAGSVSSDNMNKKSNTMFRREEYEKKSKPSIAHMMVDWMKKGLTKVVELSSSSSQVEARDNSHQIEPQSKLVTLRRVNNNSAVSLSSNSIKDESQSDSESAKKSLSSSKSQSASASTDQSAKTSDSDSEPQLPLSEVQHPHHSKRWFIHHTIAANISFPHQFFSFFTPKGVLTTSVILIFMGLTYLMIFSDIMFNMLWDPEKVIEANGNYIDRSPGSTRADSESDRSSGPSSTLRSISATGSNIYNLTSTYNLNETTNSINYIGGNSNNSSSHNNSSYNNNSNDSISYSDLNDESHPSASTIAMGPTFRVGADGPIYVCGGQRTVPRTVLESEEDRRRRERRESLLVREKLKMEREKELRMEREREARSLSLRRSEGDCEERERREIGSLQERERREIQIKERERERQVAELQRAEQQREYEIQIQNQMNREREIQRQNDIRKMENLIKEQSRLNNHLNGNANINYQISHCQEIIDKLRLEQMNLNLDSPADSQVYIDRDELPLSDAISPYQNDLDSPEISRSGPHGSNSNDKLDRSRMH